MNTNVVRTRWAAIGAAVAVTIGAGGLASTYATSPDGAVAYVPITPCRVLDTRPAPDNVGNRNTPIGAGETHTVTAHGDNGNCTGIPATATGVSLNVTAVGATTGTFLTLWANGAVQPNASNLNPQPGQPAVPNAVTTGLSATGQFDIFNGFGSVDVIVDINGYYTDHNHDDRYYTKPEVHGLIEQNAIATGETYYTKPEVDGLIEQKAIVVGDTRTDDLALTPNRQAVLSKTVATAGGANLLVSAAVEVNHISDGVTDAMTCNIDVDGVSGVAQTDTLTETGALASRRAVVSLTQVFPVGPGLHTIIVECSESLLGDSSVQDRSLSVLATS